MEAYDYLYRHLREQGDTPFTSISISAEIRFRNRTNVLASNGDSPDNP